MHHATPLVLYHGDNDQHEFYEGSRRSLLIIRNHFGEQGPRSWFVLTPSGFHGSGSLEEMIRLAAAKTGRRIEIDPSRVWSKPYKRNRMQLASLD